MRPVLVSSMADAQIHSTSSSHIPNRRGTCTSPRRSASDPARGIAMSTQTIAESPISQKSGSSENIAYACQPWGSTHPGGRLRLTGAAWTRRMALLDVLAQVAVTEQERPGHEHDDRPRLRRHAGAPGLVGAHLLAAVCEPHRVAADAVLAGHLDRVAHRREVVLAGLAHLGEHALELAARVGRKRLVPHADRRHAQPPQGLEREVALHPADARLERRELLEEGVAVRDLGPGH